MADDHIIRVILEGRDGLSKTFQGTRKELDKEVGRMQKSLKALRSDLTKTADVPLFGGGKGIRGSQGVTTVEKTRKEIERLTASIQALKRAGAPFPLGAGGPANQGVGSQQFRRGLLDFVSSFKQARKETAQIGENIRQALSTAKEDRDARRAQVDIETRAGQIRVNQVKEELRNRVQGVIQQRKALNEISHQRLADVQRIAKVERDSFLDLRKARINAIFEEQKRRIKLETTIASANITEQIKRAKPEDKEDLIRSRDKLKRDAKLLVADLNQRRLTRIKAEEKTVADLDKIDKDTFDRTKRRDNQQLNEQNTKLTQAASKASATAQRIFSDSRREAERAVGRPANAAEIRAQQQAARLAADATHDADNAIQKLGRSAGKAFGDMRRGFSEGRKGLVDFGSEAQKAETRLTRLGQNLGRVVGSFGTLANFRWFFLTSAIQLLGTFVTQLGAAFISLASSAALAGAAIGSAFAAALSQAGPVAAVFAAVASRVQTVLKAVQLNTQNRLDAKANSREYLQQQREATERLTDAQYNLKQAYIAVGEAQYNLKQSGLDLADALTRNKEAILNLAQTRIDVSRGLVDAVYNEKNAALDLRAAELGVVDAKRRLIEIEKEQKNNQADINAAKGAVREAEQRLEAARKQGDAAGVAAARAQLAVAKQSLSTVSITARTTNTAVKEAQLGLDQANLARDRSRVEDRRTKEDSARTLKQGIQGNREFIAAQREVKASVRAIAAARHQEVVAQQQVNAAIHQQKLAQRELRDAEIDRRTAGTPSGQLQLKAQLAQLSPAERELYRSIVRLQKVYKEGTRPITDIIISAIARGVQGATKLLQDPKILGAFRHLATEIGKALDKFTKFALTPQFRKDLEFFINQAAQNMPIVADALLHLVDAFLALAKHGSPLFRDFLKFLDRVAKYLDGFLNNKKKSDAFFGLAKENLDAWIKLAAAVGRLFLALGKGANKSGLKLIKDFTGFLNGISDWIDKHPKKVQKFFDDSAKSLEKIAKALVPLGKQLFKTFTSKEATDFAVFIIQILIPGLLLMTTTIQKLASVFLTLTHIPVFGKIIKFGLEFLIAEKAMNKVFPVTQKITDGFKAIGFNAIKAVPGVKGLIEQFGAFKTLGAENGYVATLGAQFPKLAAGIGVVKNAMKALLFTPPYIVAIIAGIITAVVLLNEKFHFLGPTLKFLKKVGVEILTWFKDNWKKILFYILHPIQAAEAGIKLVTDLIQKHWKDAFNFIEGLINDFLDFVRGHWQTLLKIIIGIFTFPVGPIAYAIYKWHNQMISYAGKVVSGIASAFSSLGKLILKEIEKVPGLIVDFFKGTGKKILEEIIKQIPGGNYLLKALGIAGKIFGSNKVTPQQAADTALKGGDFASQYRSQFAKVFANPTNPDNAAFLAGIDPKTRAKLKKLVRPQKHAAGGVVYASTGLTVPGNTTDTVPAMLTPGEWVLNAVQQAKLASKFGGSKKKLQDFVFGPNAGALNAGFASLGFGLTQTGLKLDSKYQAYGGSDFQLVPHQDDNGNTVWFAQFKDGTYGQVSVRDANRILASAGQFIPQYLLNVGSRHGGLHPGTLKKIQKSIKGSSLVRGPGFGAIKAYATGGPVLRSPAGSGRGGNTIHQTFSPVVQGDTDWNYVMRLGAIHATESY